MSGRHDRICVVCGDAYRTPAVRGRPRVTCSEACADELRKRRDRKDKRALRQRRLASGTCVDCRSEALPGQTRCARHSEDVRIHAHVHYYAGPVTKPGTWDQRCPEEHRE
jgi:predicted nucleic acid-binding Zn ribbon protein